MQNHHRHNGHHHHHDLHRHDHRHGAEPTGVSGYALKPAAGHNAAGNLAQWQEPHHHHPLPHEHAGEPEPDFDLVEASFAESFPRASDPTSFLRLARIPFVGRRADGCVLKLLRVEYDEATDVGSVTPHLGGETLRYDPLPAQMVSTRKRLRFVYQEGDGIARLTLGETRALSEGEA